MALVDITKAFDMVSQEGLFAYLEEIGCPPRLFVVTLSLPDDMLTTVFFEGSASDRFAVCCSVRESSVLASIIFEIFFSALLHHASDPMEDADDVLTENS